MNLSVFDTIVPLLYLLSASGFVLGLHLMNSPVTARKGSRLSETGMAIAVITTLVRIVHAEEISAVGWSVMGAGALIGGGAGLGMAQRVKMTSIPQLVSLFNAVGGGAAALVGVADFIQTTHIGNGTVGLTTSLTTVLDLVIGTVTFTGSLIAAGKLQGIVTGNPVRLPGGPLLNIVLSLGIIVGAGVLLGGSENLWVLGGIALAAAILGVTFVLPIGGADMPVVISLLNAFTGTAVAMAGFVIDNSGLIIAGALVGASGTILTKLMADAMNRSLFNVVAGGFGTGDAAVAAVTEGGASVRPISADDAAIQLAYASKVIIVPGYGLAAARAQFEVRDLAEILEARGIEVSYAIHPVAGRMPGHMNVLLAEANVPYTQLIEMDEINPEFPRADVVLVLGANDVVNPAARKPGTAVSGMPILNVDQAKSVIVMKRSMGHGYAGIDNELFTDPKTSMYFADAKAGLRELAAAVKTLTGA